MRAAPFARHAARLRFEGNSPRQQETTVNLSKINSMVPGRLLPRSIRFDRVTAKAKTALRLSIVGAAAPLAFAGHAFAAGASATNGLGAQANTMSSELIDLFGTGSGAVFYTLALICFGGGVWALWQSRQPQNRDSGNIMKGVAGLVLCGLFVTGGVWINKAANTASGGNATIGNTPAEVAFQ